MPPLSERRHGRRTPHHRTESGRTRRKNVHAFPVFDSTHTDPECATANSRTLKRLRPVRSAAFGFQVNDGSKIVWRSSSGTTGPLSMTKKSSSGLPLCTRSEEHTSELQSPCNLVCRLLLEKKKHA